MAKLIIALLFVICLAGCANMGTGKTAGIAVGAAVAAALVVSSHNDSSNEHKPTCHLYWNGVTEVCDRY